MSRKRRRAQARADVLRAARRAFPDVERRRFRVRVVWGRYYVQILIYGEDFSFWATSHKSDKLNGLLLAWGMA